MTQTIEQKITLYDRDLNLWLEEAITNIHQLRNSYMLVLYL